MKTYAPSGCIQLEEQLETTDKSYVCLTIKSLVPSAQTEQLIMSAKNIFVSNNFKTLFSQFLLK